MKKLILILLAVVSITCAWALSGGSGQGYDPSNPPDPNAAYRLTIGAAPSRLGGVSPAGSSMRNFGEGIHISASSHVGYDFRCWMEGDEVVSTEMSFYYEMPARNVTLTAWYDRNDHYDPANPGDPFFDGYTHRVNIYCTPSSGGNVYNSNFLMKEGEVTTVYAYPSQNYKFSCWKENGRIISVDPEMEIKMGDRNLSYTAQFVYNPRNPGDPGTNNWNPATGDLVIDDFEKGNLWSRISELVGDNYEAVNTLTVIGAIDDYDMNCVRNLSNLTDADFSRTYGAESLGWYAFSELKALTRVLLPASLTRIEYGAFSGCENLSELSCYASMPPTVDYNSFEGVPQTMIVKVFSSSLELYESSEIWKDYKILTLDDETTALSVNLPASKSYENASLQLANLATGETRRLVVTPNRTRYIFGNLIAGDKYSLYVMAPGGKCVGQYADFEIPASGMEYTFEQLEPLREATIRLIDNEDGRDITEQVQVNWFNDKNSFLASGASLGGLIAGQSVSYEIIPSSEFRLGYIQPVLTGSYDVTDRDNTISIKVMPVETTTITGYVYDEIEKERLVGAFIILEQDINGEIMTRTLRAREEGVFSIEAVKGFPGSLTAGYVDMIEKVIPFENPLQCNNSVIGLNSIIFGARIHLEMLTAKNVYRGENHVFESYDDYSNIGFAITDLQTLNEPDYRVRNSYLNLLGVEPEGQDARIVATSRDNSLNPVTVTVNGLDMMNEAVFRFLHDGDLELHFEGVETDSPVAILYDAKGSLVGRTEISADGKAVFTSLPAGDYTAVAMKDATVFASAATLSELENSRLSEGVDYIKASTQVEDGYISVVDMQTVPDFDESRFCYTGQSTMLALNKSSVTAGQIVTVRSLVEILPEYATSADRLTLTFTLPEGVEYVANSLLVPERGTVPATIEDGKLIVETSLTEASPRFCVKGLKSGEWRIGGSVEFMYEGDRVSQPIGSQLLTVADFTLSAPDYTYIPRITVRGYATPLSEVKVYDNDIPVGRARSLTNGEWRLTFDLTDPGTGSEHRIMADITASDGTKYKTATVRTVYDPEWAQLTDVLMINGGTTVDFNLVDATSAPSSYTYWPGTDMFTFKAIFRDGAATKVKSLDFLIYLSDGSVRRMDSKYLPSQDAWVCAVGFNDINRLPVNVKVIYSTDETVEASTLPAGSSSSLRCPDVTPVIDPSGYVYEAVPSNRLEGVQATIFYKEWAEDMYGDVYEKVIRWDAEAYAQQNPLFTDSNGMYQWDVPSGEWQVRFEKEGYEAAATEWLPVPPPQLDVNVGLIQFTAPAVQEVKAYEQAVEVTFDKYMDPARFTESNVAVTAGGKLVEGKVIAVDPEATPEGYSYTRVLRFEADAPFEADAVNVTLASRICSYAGVSLESEFTQEFDIEPEISAIEIPAEAEGYVGMDITLPVNILPGEAAAGRRLVVELDSPIAVVDGEAVTDSEGNATVTIRGELPGAIKVLIGVEGSKAAKAESVITFSLPPDPCAAPESSLSTDELLTPDLDIELSTATPGAVILYTLDGTDPAESETAMEYESPIRWLDYADTSDLHIRAIARADGMLDSPESEFVYKKDISLGIDPIADAESLVTLGQGNITLKGDCTVSICDAEGRVYLSNRAMGTGDVIDLTRFSHGIYIVTLGTPESTHSLRIRN